MPATILALEGAESTGKSVLAQALCTSLSRAGVKVLRVDEALRSFCEARGRTPRADEQAAIAATQEHQIAKAAAQADLVVADTTGLMTAVYSEVVFSDLGLYAQALARRRADLTLVTGLDLPWMADGHQRDGPTVQAAVDAALRLALAHAGLPYSVVYGTGLARSAAALQALGQALPAWRAAAQQALNDLAPETQRPRRWRTRCEDCLQPDCEHLRLLP